MRILIIYNPIAGRGRSAACAAHLAERLAVIGHSAATIPSRLDPVESWLDPMLQQTDLLVVAGGDGAMRMVAHSASLTRVPVYHVPLGTENLFAREFGMDGVPESLVQAIERWRVVDVDLGEANGLPFLLMASVGFDAEVVHVLATSRTSSISPLTYLKPVFSTLMRWRAAPISVLVDDCVLIDDRRGLVVIANSRQYGWRIDPAHLAVMDDHLLDVVFFPADTGFHLIPWVIRCRRRTQFEHPGLVWAQAQNVLVQSDSPFRFQLDGDPPVARTESSNEASVTRLHCRIQLSSMRVLMPVHGPQT